jgi:hypothetical protein
MAEYDAQIPEIDIEKIRTIDLNIKDNKITSLDDSIRVLKQIYDKGSINAYEEVKILFLDNSNKVIGIYNHSKGGITGTIIDVEMICALALKCLAKAVIMSHNHPSGSLKFSTADITMTKNLKNALNLFNIALLDSIVITDFGFTSMTNEGILAFGGGIRKVGNREYPLGRNWTNDHKHINKSEEHEVLYIRKGFFDGGGEVEFIEYKDSEIMYEPNDKKYYANDMEFDTLKEAKKFIDSGEVPYFIKDAYSKGLFAGGGSISNFIKKTYGNLVEKQGYFTTLTNWYNKDGVKVLEYGFDPYRNEESNTLFYYSWDYRDSGMDYDDFRNQLVDFFKKTYKKNVSELKALYVGWKRKEKDTYANGGSFMDGVYAGGGSISNFDPMSLMGKTFYSLQSHGKIINIRILSDDNIKIKYEVSNTFSVEKSFTKKELFDMAKGKEVDGNSILKSTMAYGGKTTFAEKSSAIAKNFVGKAVEPKYQKEYGKRYDSKEAKEVGNKIAGKQKASYDQNNMKSGGSVKSDKLKKVTQKAKEIRKEGEKWQSAMKRAYAMMK